MKAAHFVSPSAASHSHTYTNDDKQVDLIKHWAPQKQTIKGVLLKTQNDFFYLSTFYILTGSQSGARQLLNGLGDLSCLTTCWQVAFQNARYVHSVQEEILALLFFIFKTSKE